MLSGSPVAVLAAVFLGVGRGWGCGGFTRVDKAERVASATLQIACQRTSFASVHRLGGNRQRLRAREKPHSGCGWKSPGSLVGFTAILLRGGQCSFHRTHPRMAPDYSKVVNPHVGLVHRDGSDVSFANLVDRLRG